MTIPGDTNPDPFSFMRAATAYTESKILLTVAELGIFAVPSGRIDSKAFARQHNLSEEGLTLLLNALIAFHIIRREDDGSYRLEEEITALFNRYPGMTADLMHHNHLYHVRERLGETVRTGKSLGPPKEELQAYPASLEMFLMAMRAHAAYLAPGLCRLLEWEGKRNLLDLGGGGAGFADAFTKAFRNLSVIIADLPDAIAVTAKHFEKGENTKRIFLYPCNCYEDPLPDGPFDGVLISHLVHIYSDSDNRRLIQKAARSLQAGGEMLLLDYFLDEQETAPKEAVVFRLLMKMGTPQGDCYSLPVVRNWLESAGLAVHRVIPLKGGNTLVTARQR